MLILSDFRMDGVKVSVDLQHLNLSAKQIARPRYLTSIRSKVKVPFGYF
jgi:hypothetical protein